MFVISDKLANFALNDNQIKSNSKKHLICQATDRRNIKLERNRRKIIYYN
ncbi:hypothetical protein SAMN05444338_11499 [Flavobacterium degerlachei]|uniref:Uncharacterized protein n=1 Tax=Flavobacterium degerlachei TaxID=229203 RepID=A0A1H3EBI6_9FLAO|nr:hypothetical protein SAMN05444338_11499 [Flavobacterium degerlachei]